MKPAAKTIDLTKLSRESKDVVESMAHELTEPEQNEPTSDLRWPTRFITDIKKAAKRD